jgi:hypothetical protein
MNEQTTLLRQWMLIKSLGSRNQGLDALSKARQEVRTTTDSRKEQPDE